MKYLRLTVLTSILLLLVPGTLLAASDYWLHVRVEEDGGKSRVMINLPLTLIEVALPLLPEEHLHGGKIVLDEVDLTTAELRKLWEELKSSPNMTYVTVEDEDETVRVSKTDDHLLVQTTKRRAEGDSVDVRIPIRVVDALLAGEGDELDVRAAVEALIEEGEGELVTVDDNEDRVRVWIDQTAEGE